MQSEHAALSSGYIRDHARVRRGGRMQVGRLIVFPNSQDGTIDQAAWERDIRLFAKEVLPEIQSWKTR